MSASQTYSVRFCEWRTFAITISATTQEDAIKLAQTLRETHGTEPFEELDGGSDGWDAEEGGAA
jgi:hypothetical protein